jgi:hypothetical protein
MYGQQHTTGAKNNSMTETVEQRIRVKRRGILDKVKETPRCR